ncbi:MAG: hypothetical protein ACTSRR_11480 [Candidatus Heimdallarchaeaceae archaeon]
MSERTDDLLSRVLSELQKMNSRIVELNKSMSQISKQYEKVVKIQDQSIKVQNDQKSLIDAQLDYLYTTAESINRMTIMDLNTQLIETDITKQTSETLEVEAKLRMERAIEKYREEYGKIIRDFVNGIVANIKHFAKLNEEHIRPLFEIINNLERVYNILSSFTAEHPDLEILDYAVSTFDERKNRIDQSYSETKEVLTEFITKREEAEDTINTFYVKNEELNLEDIPEETISLISIPFAFTFLENNSGLKLKVNGPLKQEPEFLSSYNVQFRDLCPSMSNDLYSNENTKEKVLRKVNDQQNLLKQGNMAHIIEDLTELLTSSGFYPKHLKNLPKLFKSPNISFNDTQAELGTQFGGDEQ